MVSSLHQCLFCPIVWMYFGIIWACSRLWWLLCFCFQWIFKILRCPFSRERRNSLTDITSRDNVDIGEYDVLEREEVTGSDFEETVAFNSSTNSSQFALLCQCTKNKTLPICIPRRTKPKKDCYDAFRTTSTLDAEDRYHHRTPGKLMRTISKDDISVSTTSSSSEPSLIFSMSPVE